MAKDADGVSLDSLLGERLSAVVFVLDYIQLMFDNQQLSVTTSIEVAIDNKVYVLGMEGFRDKLCERITSIVTGTEIIDDKKIKISFNDSSHLEILLSGEDQYKGNEAVIFHGLNNSWWVLHQV